MKKQKPVPQKPRSKEQIIVDAEMLRRKKKIRDVLYPIITDTSFFDAANFLSGTQQLVKGIFMNDMRYKKLKDYGMKATTGSPYPQLTEYFLEALDEESVESGLWMLGQLEQAIASFKDAEIKGRKVGTFKTEFNEF